MKEFTYTLKTKEGVEQHIGVFAKSKMSAYDNAIRMNPIIDGKIQKNIFHRAVSNIQLIKK